MPDYQTLQIPIATRGLNKDLQATQIPNASPNMINMMVENWGVRKRLGYSTVGTNLPLSGIGMELIQYIDAEGTIHHIALTTTCAYEYDTDTEQWLNICAPTVLEDCEDDWVDDNVNTCAAQAGAGLFKVGSKAILVSITSDVAATTLLCHEGITSADITGANMFSFWVRCNKALSANTLEIVLSETAAGSDPKTGSDGTDYITLTNPLAMSADTWYNFSIPLTGDDAPTNLNAVVNVALYSNHATELDGNVTETKIYIDDLKVTTGFTGDYTNRWSHTIAHDANYFTNNGGTALIISNNVDTIRYYEGDSADTIAVLDVSDFASLAYCREIAEFWNHFFVLNYNDGSTHIRSLAYADIGNIDEWTSGTSGSNTLTDTRGKLLRAKKLGAYMIIYSENTITTCRYLGGVALFVFPTLVYETGLYGEKAIWDFVNVHYFLGTDQKIYGYSGGQQLTHIGEAIEDSMFTSIDATKKDRITVGLDPAKHKLYFLFPTSGTTYAEKAYVYNYKQTPPTWEYHEFGDSIRDFSIFSNRADWYADGSQLAGTYADELVLYADASFTQSGFPIATVLSHDGYVFQLDETGQDNASNIACTYETMDLTADAEEHYFRVAWLSFNAMSSLASATVDIEYSVDSGANWTTIQLAQSISSAAADTWAQHRLPFDVVTRRIRFRFTQDSAKDFQLRMMHMKYDVITDRE